MLDLQNKQSSVVKEKNENVLKHFIITYVNIRILFKDNFFFIYGLRIFIISWFFFNIFVYLRVNCTRIRRVNEKSSINFKSGFNFIYIFIFIYLFYF